MGMMAIVILVTLLCVGVLFAMVNVQKDSSSKEQKGSEDLPINDIENERKKDERDE